MILARANANEAPQRLGISIKKTKTNKRGETRTGYNAMRLSCMTFFRVDGVFSLQGCGIIIFGEITCQGLIMLREMSFNSA
jgi:hypothetical protein